MTRLLVAGVLAAALIAGCKGAKTESTEPAADPAPAGHPALNKLNTTRDEMKEIEAKRKQQGIDAGLETPTPAATP